MTRAFRPDPLPDGLLDDLVDLAARAPSAGKTQGWHLLVLEGGDTERFWNVTLPVDRRDRFGWPHLLDAPVIALPFADSQAYLDRYSEPDKVRAGLGGGADAWPVPYWTIDASMSLMTLLLGAEAAGLGALFFGVFEDEDRLRADLGVPEGLELLGAVALGYPRHDVEGGAVGLGRSATRPRRSSGEIIHRGSW